MLVLTVVLRKGCPVTSIGSVLVKYNAVIFLIWQQLVDVVKVAHFSVPNYFGLAPQNPSKFRIQESFVNKPHHIHLYISSA